MFSIKTKGNINVVLVKMLEAIYSEVHIVAYLLKARIVKPAETAIAREQLCKHARC
jgi:hypothetical protein